MYKQYQQSDPFNYHIQYIHYAPYGELIENISPYAYCALNPVKYVDLDGMVSRYYINKKESSTKSFMFQAFIGWKKRFDDNRLHLWFHGSKDGIYYITYNNKTDEYNINKVDKFEALDLQFSTDPLISETWLGITSSSSEYTEPKEVVFHGCYTA